MKNPILLLLVSCFVHVGTNATFAQSSPPAPSEAKDLSVPLEAAQKLFQSGKLDEAWKGLRQLYDQAPENAGVQMGIRAMIDEYKRRGLLSVGTTQESLTGLLGSPHKTVAMPWGTRLVYGAMALDLRDSRLHELVHLIGATEELFDASHVIDVDLGQPRWPIGIRQKGDGVVTAFLYPEGQSIAKWTEMVAIERFVGQAKERSLKDNFELAQKQILAQVSDAKVYVIDQRDSTVFFAVSFPARDGQLAKQQLVRLWAEARDVHRLAYTHIGDLPSETEQKKWSMTFMNAELKQYDPSVSATSKAFAPEAEVKKIAEAIRADFQKASQYKPTGDALTAIAASDEAKQKLQRYCDAVYGELPPGGAGEQNQTEILVFGPDINELPGGYKKAIEYLKPNVKIYGFKYVRPGEKLGMSYDGAFQVDGKWYFLPKAFRAFQ
jgi:hypothetical protein